VPSTFTSKLVSNADPDFLIVDNENYQQSVCRSLPMLLLRITIFSTSVSLDLQKWGSGCHPDRIARGAKPADLPIEHPTLKQRNAVPVTSHFAPFAPYKPPKLHHAFRGGVVASAHRRTHAFGRG